MGGGKRKRGTCTYCGRQRKLTRDHVFPKSLFIKYDPNMLTVPVCDDCNQLKSKGDSDLEVFANLDIYGSTHPDNLKHLERIAQRGQSTVDW
jgi:5-methylcytosine-specific restriction endonuclease McrA